MNRWCKKAVRAVTAAITVTGMLAGCGSREIPLKAKEDIRISFDNVSVHDPSIVEYEDTYYIFGSHLAGAKSTDLMNWEMIGDGVRKMNPIIPDVFNEMPDVFEWSQSNTLWAPDVFQLEDGRFYMYYCACEGSSPLSCLGLAVADNIEGPYKDLGIFLRSGMTGEPSENGDVYDATVQPNVVDPCIFYDTEGRLWMMYGSYSGGIYILELDKTTGLPLESGYGKKILGANHLRIEAAFVEYNPETEYYYLFLSFGGLDSTGAYNIRVCRSRTPDGPYYDSTGTDMIECAGDPGTYFDDRKAEQYGVKLMGNYKWTWHEGENGEDRRGLVSPGHNSTLYDEETGKYFIIFHTRFEGLGEQHEVRVHQMFFNEAGWPVIAPYRYVGETIGQYEKKDVEGTYKLVKHGRQITTKLKESVDITLESNGKVTGAYEGSWELTEGNHLKLTLGEEVYQGVFCKQYDEFGLKYVMGFTTLSEQGIAVWGSGLAALDTLN